MSTPRTRWLLRRRSTVSWPQNGTTDSSQATSTMWIDLEGLPRQHLATPRWAVVVATGHLDGSSHSGRSPSIVAVTHDATRPAVSAGAPIVVSSWVSMLARSHRPKAT